MLDLISFNRKDIKTIFYIVSRKRCKKKLSINLDNIGMLLKFSKCLCRCFS